MADPLSLLPFALAAGGGTLDGLECRQLVAAGLALRPRSAIVARALAQSPAFLLLPPSAAILTALAACDGVPVTLLDPEMGAGALGPNGPPTVVFTRRAYETALSARSMAVLLDEAPTAATVRYDGRELRVDLGSHFAMDIAGEREAEGHPDVCLIERTADGAARPWTHRALLRAIRAHGAQHGLTPLHVHQAATSWHVVDDFIAAAATLYVGGRVETTRRFAGA